MDESNKIEALRRSRLAAELSDEECEILARIIVVRQVADGETLMREGQTDHCLHVIHEGKLAVYKAAGAGEEEILHVHKVGDVTGAMGFLDGLEHSATLRAQGKVEVLSLERNPFEALIETHPRLVYKVMRAIVRSVHAIVRNMNSSYVEMFNYITKQHGRY